MYLHLNICMLLSVDNYLTTVNMNEILYNYIAIYIFDSIVILFLLISSDLFFILMHFC